MKGRTCFFTSLGLLIALNAFIKPLWIFGIDREVQNAVGPAEYGSYFSILGLSVFFSFLLDWGFTVFFNRQLSLDPENFSKRIGGFVLLKIVFAIVYASIVAAIAEWVNRAAVMATINFRTMISLFLI